MYFIEIFFYCFQYVFYECNATKLQQDIHRFYDRYNLPIWLLTYNCNATNEQELVKFALESFELFDNDPIIERYWKKILCQYLVFLYRYAWFGMRKEFINYGMLSNSSIALSAVGNAYSGNFVQLTYGLCSYYNCSIKLMPNANNPWRM